MPELPEVEITCRGISPHLIGATINAVEVRESRLRLPINYDFAQSILGKRVVSISRRAKYLILALNSGTILIHLGMSGRLKIMSQATPAQKHDHVDISFNNGKLMRYTDPRRFGLMQSLNYAVDQHPFLQNLGPEPLSDNFTGEYLHQHAQRRTVAIKNYIMDNKIVVGVGNIYASESLFLTGIHPLCAANKISLDRFEKLAHIIKAVLRKSIEQGGTTLKDFYQSDGQPGYFAQSLNVYGRDGKACYTCQQTIHSVVIGQRNSYFCPSCQT